MNLYFTERFKKQYRKLTSRHQKKIDKQLVFLQKNPQHPSLQTRKLISSIWYCRGDQNYRITFLWEGDTIILRNVDRHDDVFFRP